MRIDLSSINRDEFFINEASIPRIGDVRLVVPQKGKFKWAESEKHLRSLLCRPDGEVVSAGFNKFGNLREFVWNDMYLTSALENRRRVRFLKKLDGTLVIRSVIDGHVHFRTRGHHVLGEFEDRVMKLIRDRHPALLDPSISPDASLLFEYVGPDNHIVVRYEEPTLFALAEVRFKEFESLHISPLFLGPRSAQLRMEPAPEIPMAGSLEEMERRISLLEGEEGYVVWAENDGPGWNLVKCKSNWYFRLHALRSEATPRYVREYCFKNSVWTFEAFKHKITSEGFDWELVSYLTPIFETAHQRYLNVLRETNRIDTIIEDENLRGNTDRKSVALRCKEITTQEYFSYAINRATKNDVNAEDFRSALILEMGVPSFKQWKKDEGI